MALYVIAAEGIPVVKIGVTFGGDHVGRLSTMQSGSPVRLRIAALDPAGDYLTEADLLLRFSHERLHGEWLTASAAVRTIVAAIAEGRPVPDGLYLPRGFPPRTGNGQRGASPETLCVRLGLTRTEFDAVVGRRVWNNQAGYGIGMANIAKLYRHLEAQGRPVALRDLLPEPWNVAPTIHPPTIGASPSSYHHDRTLVAGRDSAGGWRTVPA